MWRAVRAALVSLAPSMLAFACGSFGTDRVDAPDASPSSPSDGGTSGDAATRADGEPPANDSGGSSSGDSGGKDGSTSVERIIFTTRGAWNANLGGLQGADAKCQAAADASVKTKGRSYRAWLGTSGQPVQSRFTGDDRALRLPDNTLVASNWKSFATSVHTKALNIDEAGLEVDENNMRAWTASEPDGASVAGGTTCTLVEWLRR